ncbi:DUF58 domain-containing protein [Fictibacillus sp. Mic-4]|uniref:DUF58 domain-containing protein n=1 Tax=Fictibacillus sp. Mic-4 TaxID=3132826 RepID=UPI003CF69F7F
MIRLKWKLSNKYRTPIGFIGILFLLICTFSYAMFQGGFVSWFLFYSSLPLVLYTILMFFYRLGNVQIVRELNKEKLVAGESLEVTITMKRSSWFPLLYLVIVDELPEALAKHADQEGEEYIHQSRGLFFPLFKKTLSYTYYVHPVPRGVYDLSKVMLKSGDIFGFVEKIVNVQVTDHLFVYPRYQEIDRWEIDRHLYNGDQRAGRRSRTDFTSTISVRDYAPGDRLAWLHWKASARSNKLLTKVFEHQRNDDFTIIIDQSIESYGGKDLLFEKAVSFAASLIRYSIQKGGAVGFYVLDENEQIPMNSGYEQEWRIMHELARVKANHKKAFEIELKEEFAEGNLDGKTMVILSPLLTESLVKTMELISMRNSNLIFFYIAQGTKLSTIDYQFINRLNQRMIATMPIIGEQFNEALKAGVKHATS